jgi:predicted HicB family RNase H-like nuclease
MTPTSSQLLAKQRRKAREQSRKLRGITEQLGPGRPSLSGHGVSPQICFRMSPALHERARAHAAREGKALGQLAREALEHYIDR